MKAALVSLAVLVASTTIAPAHLSKPLETPAPSTVTSPVASWRYALPNFRINRYDNGAGQTLTGGPSGSPSQS